MKYSLPFLTVALFVTTLVSNGQTPAPVTSGPAESQFAIDSLIARDSYVGYAEVRNLGRLSQTRQVVDIFEAMQMLESMPPEVAKIKAFLDSHSEELDGSRAIIGFYPSRPGIPQTVIAIEISTPQAAEKLEPELLKTLLSLTAPKTSAAKNKTTEILSPVKQLEARGMFYARRGMLVCLADSKIDFAALRPASSAAMSADPVFESSRAKFASDSVFVYYNRRIHEKVQVQEDKDRAEREKQAEIERKAMADKARALEAENRKNGNQPLPSPSVPEVAVDNLSEQTAIATLGTSSSPEPPAPSPTPESAGAAASGKALGALFGAAGNLASKWPDGIAGALSFEGDDLVARVILLNKEGEAPVAIPFLPFLIMGPPVSNRAVSLTPADTDVFVTGSLDLPKMYEALLTPAPRPKRPENQTGQTENAVDEQTTSTSRQIKLLEPFLGFRVKEDLIAAFGNEVAVAARLHPRIIKNADGVTTGTDPKPSYALMISLQNREAAQKYLPKLLETIGMRAAGAGATERFNDIDITNYTSFSLAFTDDFMIASIDNAGVKEILESTGGQGSLATSVAYRNATLWQPQQRTLQAFVSRTLTDAVFKGFGVFDYAGDTGKAFLTRFRAEPRAVTFSTSSDAGIYQHELHIPQALVLNWVGQALLAPKYGEIIGNEAMARYVLNAVSAAEKNYKQSKGQYGTLDDLVKSNMLPGFFREQKAYNFEVTLSGESFSATATPAEYGPKGKHSFFIDTSGILRSGDLNGRRATASEPPAAGDTLGGIF